MSRRNTHDSDDTYDDILSSNAGSRGSRTKKPSRKDEQDLSNLVVGHAADEFDLEVGEELTLTLKDVSVLGDRPLHKANDDYDVDDDEFEDVLEHSELAKAREAQKAKERSEKFKRKRAVNDDAGMLDKYDSDEEGPRTKLSDLRAARKEKGETLAEGLQRMGASEVVEMGGVKRTLINDDFYTEEDMFKQRKPKKEKKEKKDKRRKTDWADFEEDEGVSRTSAGQKPGTGTGTGAVSQTSTLAAILGTSAISADDANSNTATTTGTGTGTGTGSGDLSRRSGGNTLLAGGLSDLLALEQRKALKATAYISALNAANAQNAKLWVDADAGSWRAETEAEGEATDAKSRLERLRAKTTRTEKREVSVVAAVGRAREREKQEKEKEEGTEGIAWRAMGFSVGIKEETGNAAGVGASAGAGMGVGTGISGMKVEEDIFAAETTSTGTGTGMSDETVKQETMHPTTNTNTNTNTTVPDTVTPTTTTATTATTTGMDGVAAGDDGEGFQRAKAQARSSTLAAELTGHTTVTDEDESSRMREREQEDAEALAEWEREERMRKARGDGESGLGMTDEEKRGARDEAEEIFEHLSGNPMITAKLLNIARDRGYFKREHLTRHDGRHTDKVVDESIVYYDDQGRELTTKEAFRHLSYKFHGYGPSKNKLEKQIKKREKERGPSEAEKKKAARLLQQMNASPFLRIDTENNKVEAVSMNRKQLEQYKLEKEAKEQERARKKEERLAAKAAQAAAKERNM